MEEKILTKHPRGKEGMHINKAKYDVMREAILAALQEAPGLTHTQLTRAVEGRLRGTFAGSIPWYLETIKLDLEARDLIRRTKDGAVETYRVP